MNARSWQEFTPVEAVELGDISKRDDVTGPRNELGEECPWPWDPQQLVGAPMGMYHCPYCGAMVMAGLQHPDYGEAEHRLVDRKCICGWEPKLGASIYRSFDQHLLEVRRG